MHKGQLKHGSHGYSDKSHVYIRPIIKETEPASKIKEKEYLNDQQSAIWVTSYFVQYPLLRHWPHFKEKKNILLH